MRTRRQRPPAFTLTELLIVMGILAVLATLAAPTIQRMVGAARATVCRSNLHQLSSWLLQETASGIDLQHRTALAVPDFSRWEAIIAESEQFKLTICPADTEPPTDPYEAFRDLYFHQSSSEGGHWGEFDTPLYDMLNGATPPDKQVCYMYQSTTFVGSYYPDAANYPWDTYLATIGGTLDDNQLLMTAGSGAIVVTFHETYIVMNEYDPRYSWTQEYGHLIGSNHYLSQGTGDNWEDEVIRTFIGRSNKDAARSFAAFSKTSYGMNSLVTNSEPNPSQLYMVEYSDPEMMLHYDPLDEPFDGDIDNGEIMARHEAKANYVTVDGAVSSAFRADLQDEYTNPAGLFHP
jgi:prepilin-type N-terminal cleavage/methylation domain-containing protein